MSESPGVAVGMLLQGRSEGSGLTLDLLAGAGGLDRQITSPHVQKTGLALAGFDEYLRPGRVLIFGESEIRYLERLDAAARVRALHLALGHDFPCILITGGVPGPPELPTEAGPCTGPPLETPRAPPS